MITEEQHNAAIQEGRKARRDAAIERVAYVQLGIDTLDIQNSDQLDFHTLAVWTITQALEAAYEAGRESQR